MPGREEREAAEDSYLDKMLTDTAEGVEPGEADPGDTDASQQDHDTAEGGGSDAGGDGAQPDAAQIARVKSAREALIQAGQPRSIVERADDAAVMDWAAQVARDHARDSQSRQHADNLQRQIDELRGHTATKKVAEPDKAIQAVEAFAAKFGERFDPEAAGELKGLLTMLVGRVGDAEKARDEMAQSVSQRVQGLEGEFGRYATQAIRSRHAADYVALQDDANWSKVEARVDRLLKPQYRNLEEVYKDAIEFEFGKREMLNQAIAKIDKTREARTRGQPTSDTRVHQPKPLTQMSRQEREDAYLEDLIDRGEDPDKLQRKYAVA